MTYAENRVYKKVEVIGVSTESIEGAVQTAVSRARNSLQKLSWFEVQEVRGHIDEAGKVCEYQVVLKVAFEIE